MICKKSRKKIQQRKKCQSCVSFFIFSMRTLNNFRSYFLRLLLFLFLFFALLCMLTETSCNFFSLLFVYVCSFFPFILAIKLVRHGACDIFLNCCFVFRFFIQSRDLSVLYFSYLLCEPKQEISRSFSMWCLCLQAFHRRFHRLLMLSLENLDPIQSIAFVFILLMLFWSIDRIFTLLSHFHPHWQRITRTKFT